MDDADKSAAPVEAEVECRIMESRNAQPEALATGRCLNCDKRLARGKRWCDRDCLEDWQKREGLILGR